jgi:hypothetical protein
VWLAAACAAGWWLLVHRHPDPATKIRTTMKHEMTIRKTVAAFKGYLERIFR